MEVGAWEEGVKESEETLQRSLICMSEVSLRL